MPVWIHSPWSSTAPRALIIPVSTASPCGSGATIEVPLHAEPNRGLQRAESVLFLCNSPIEQDSKLTRNMSVWRLICCMFHVVPL